MAITFVKHANGQVMVTDNNGVVRGFDPSENVLPHPAQANIVQISRQADQETSVSWLFDWNDVTTPTVTSRNNCIQQLLEDFFFSLTDAIRRGSDAVIDTGTVIAFSAALPSTNYVVSFYCYDGTGDTVEGSVSSKTVNGFTFTPAVNGTLEYIAIPL